MNELMQDYIEDVKNMLGLLDETLEKIKSMDPKEALDNFHRVVHTMKGNSAAVQFTAVEENMKCVEHILAERTTAQPIFDDKTMRMLSTLRRFLDELYLWAKGDQTMKLQTEDLMAICTDFTSSERMEKDMMMKQGDMLEYLEQLESESPKLKALMVDLDNHIGVFTVKLEDNCIMKNVRAWLTLEKFDQLGQNIHSYPNRQIETNGKHGDIEMVGSTLYVTLCTPLSLERVKEKMMKTPEIENVTYLPYEEIAHVTHRN